MSQSYILKSPKAIEFYNKNNHLDFNNMNELFVDIIQKLTSSVQSTISVNEIKSLLHCINSKVEHLDKSIGTNSAMTKMTYDNLTQNKEFYINQIQTILQKNDEDNQILRLIRETNETLVEKTIYSILQQFPKLNETMSAELKQIMFIQQNEIVQETQKSFDEMFRRQDKTNVEQLIHDNYQSISQKIQDMMFNNFQNHESNVVSKLTETQQLFQVIGHDFQSFLEKQKNSTLKGKESEEKLESCLVSAFPQGDIMCQSGKPQSCDYLVKRNDKPDILFENKDYTNNVPHEEIKKFIRDIEYQNKHGILLSQHSGITQKNDYQIDIHAGNIMVYLHFVRYDESKIRVAVNLIDHLYTLLKTHGNNHDLNISMDELSEINKEYLNFIGQKKSLIETTKKMHKDQIKALEDFEMPKLTHLLNSKFTNVEQLSYKCEICGVYTAKNKRALVTHQNKCKKKKLKQNDVINLENKEENEIKKEKEENIEEKIEEKNSVETISNNNEEET